MVTAAPPHPPLGGVHPLVITTPDLVSFRVVPAGLVTRLTAWLIDAVIVLAIRIGVLFPLAGGEVGIALILAVWLIVDFGYYTVFEWNWSGQTPGKRALGLRVSSAAGVRLQPGDVLLRNLVRVIDGIPPVIGLGGLVALCDRHNRRLGDLIAGTVVVSARSSALPATVARAAREDNSLWADAGVRRRILARVTREERDLLLDLLVRRDQLAMLERASLFDDAARYFAERFGIPPETEHLSHEQTVLGVAAVICRADDRADPGRRK